jgi:hypothetical protein
MFQTNIIYTYELIAISTIFVECVNYVLISNYQNIKRVKDCTSIMAKQMDENNCEFVCSRGILKLCDIYSSNPVSSIPYVRDYNFSNFQSGMSIYIASTALRDFLGWIDMIPGKFILVTGDCDICVPNDVFPNQADFVKFIENPKLIRWHSQNCIGNHPKLHQIPIGLDYHTMSVGDHSWGPKTPPVKQEEMLKRITQNAEPFWNRINGCYANFQFLMTTRFSYDRGDAINNVPRELVYYEPTKTTRENCWNTQVTYAFVLSPHGNGLDCHRTWEALCLGCIPIVKTSSLDPLYDGLPVLIVKEWSDVNVYLLTNTIIKFKTIAQANEFTYENLRLDYWMKQINA